MHKTWKIKYYTLIDTNSPVYEFIESLPDKTQSKLVNTFDLLTEFGVQLRQPHAKKVAGTPLWELRILGEENIRIFYVAVSDATFLLLHGFTKKKQKTPQKEIRTTLKRLEEYRARS